MCWRPFEHINLEGFPKREGVGISSRVFFFFPFLSIHSFCTFHTSLKIRLGTYVLRRYTCEKKVSMEPVLYYEWILSASICAKGPTYIDNEGVMHVGIYGGNFCDFFVNSSKSNRSFRSHT